MRKPRDVSLSLTVAPRDQGCRLRPHELYVRRPPLTIHQLSVSRTAPVSSVRLSYCDTYNSPSIYKFLVDINVSFFRSLKLNCD